MSKNISSKSTKNEILDVLNEVTEEKEQLEQNLSEAEGAVEQLTKENKSLKSQLEALRKEKKSTEPAPSTPQEPPARGDRKPMPEIQTGATIPQIINDLTSLKARFGTAVSELSTRLTSEVSTLQQLRRTTESGRQRLETLYGLQISDTTLETLIQDYQVKSRTFEEDFKVKKTTFEQEFSEKQKTWRKEQDDHALVIKDRNASAQKTRQREEAEYRFILENARKLDNEAYTRLRKELDQALVENRQVKEKEWAKREQSIAEREKQADELKAKVENFQKELEAAVKKAANEGTGIATHQARLKADLIAKETEGVKRVKELQIQSLETTITKQSAQIQALSAQLTAALKQAQDLAVKAIEGASTETSFQAVREIAMEQAKNQQKSK